MTVRGAAKGYYSRYHQKYNIGFINSDGMEDERSNQRLVYGCKKSHD